MPTAFMLFSVCRCDGLRIFGRPYHLAEETTTKTFRLQGSREPFNFFHAPPKNPPSIASASSSVSHQDPTCEQRKDHCCPETHGLAEKAWNLESKVLGLNLKGKFGHFPTVDLELFTPLSYLPCNLRQMVLPRCYS